MGTIDRIITDLKDGKTIGYNNVTMRWVNVPEKNDCCIMVGCWVGGEIPHNLDVIDHEVEVTMLCDGSQESMLICGVCGVSSDTLDTLRLIRECVMSEGMVHVDYAKHEHAHPIFRDLLNGIGGVVGIDHGVPGGDVSVEAQVAKHTPGPWRVEYNHDNKPMGVCSPSTWKHDLDLLCNIPYTDPRWRDEVEANAHLIAAAPELLEQLEVAHEILSSIPSLVESLGQEPVEAWSKTHKEREAIIAIAKGVE